MTRDSHSTPDELATHLLRLGPLRLQSPTIADFAAGNGQLLRFAAQQWPEGRMIASDIDGRKVSGLRRRFPDWLVTKVDFLDPSARDESPLLRNISGAVDLILMNPPFSCRGGTKLSVDVQGEKADCSVAMAFVLIGLTYLGEGGEIRAILPASILSSHKDSHARSLLGRSAVVEIRGRCARNTFNGCFPHAVVIRVKKRKRLIKLYQPESQKKSPKGTLGPVEIVRGSIQMHTLPARAIGGLIPLIHSTELQRREKLNFIRYVGKDNLVIGGPAVLLPRVGKPSLEKIIVLPPGSNVALSDCVLGVRCSSLAEARRICSRISSDWRGFELVYGGTGAPYITIGHLASILESFGVIVKKPADATYQYARSLDHRCPSGEPA